MKTVDEIRKAFRIVELDDADSWKIEDRADNYVKLVPPPYASITYQMLAKIELALGTDRINLKHVDATPGYALSSVTYESGEPGYVYLDVFDK